MSTIENKFVVTHVIDKVSDLTYHQHFSPQVEHFNIPWRLSYQKIGEEFSCHLHCEISSEGDWSVNTKYELKLMSISGGVLTRPFEHTFTSDSEFNGMGFPFMIWRGIQNWLLVDDKLILVATVVVEKMSGIEEPKKLKDFDMPSNLYSEAVLLVGDEKFHVLKGHLAVQSSYFESLFYGMFNEAQQTEIVLQDIDPKAFQCFLELLYLAPSLTDSNIEGVVELCDMYDAKNGARICEQYLLNDSKHSLRTKIRIAAQYKFENLKKHCISNMKSAADVRSVMGPDLNDMNQSISHELLEKSLSFFF